ncbi:MAG: acetate/propionate family kinase [Chloroflexota bacterium]
MIVLTVNCGSSTLKFDVIQAGEQEATAAPRKAHGVVDRIGGAGGTFYAIIEGGDRVRAETAGVDHDGAARRMMEWLESQGLLEPQGIEAIGHRVVHGGYRFAEPVIIDDEVTDAIEETTALAPLHNEPALNAIRTVRTMVRRDVPMVAVFDTCFHSAMPRQASRYAIAQELVDRHHIRRYGFHGLAHRFMVERYADISERSRSDVRVITLQLGNGCSAAAISGGQSVDTSMGLTPLEGLMMGTRCGDVDPSLVAVLSRAEGVDVAEVEEWLNNRSGLLGVSGVSADMRQLLEAEREGNGAAALAVEMFCYRVKKYVGAYLNVLGGAEAVVFGGGIGENTPSVRSRVCAGMEWCGLKLDADRNEAAMGTEARISKDRSTMAAYVIPVDEAVLIARDTARCLGGGRKRIGRGMNEKGRSHRGAR